MAKFDHDFIGREALAAEIAEPRRTTVTLRWNADDDVIDTTFASLLRPGVGYKPIDFPYAPQRWPMAHADHVLMEGREIGYSSGTIYSSGFREFLSLGCIGCRQRAQQQEPRPVSTEPSSSDNAKESPMHIDEAVAGEARAVVERYITAINAGDGAGVQDALNFPHFRVGAQGRVTYYPDQSSDHLANFRKRTQADGWNRSEIDRMEVIYTQADKAHLLLWFRRLRADGSLIGAYHSLYIITEVGGHWGIQGGSGSGL